MNSELQTDLSVEAFLTLRDHFCGADSVPIPYLLEDKLNTQDDPLDRYICAILGTNLREGIEVVKARGPLITPDMVVYRPHLCNQQSKAELRVDSTCILGLEVKKLERQDSGGVARASGMDYNTTPPCGIVRVYDGSNGVLDIRGFCLFVCQEPVLGEARTYRLTALALCDGNLLNEDFDYYISIIGQRTKEIGLGTFGDGANRVRPMIIFSNPLGVSFLDHQSTMIHSRDDLEAQHPTLRYIGTIERTVPAQTDFGVRVFHCYRDSRDVPEDAELLDVRDPFPTPRRTDRTIPRGRFVIGIRPSD